MLNISSFVRGTDSSKFKFTFMHLADAFIQSDIQQRIEWYLLFTENPTERSILQ